MLKVTYSQIAAYLKCKKAWKYSYLDNLAPRVDRPAMQLGTLVHTYLEYALKNDSVMCYPDEAVDEHLNEYFNSRKMFDEELRYYSEDLGKKAKVIGQRAYENLTKDYEVISPKLVEYNFNYHISDSIIFVGKVDAVVRHKRTNTNWILDHKVRGTFQSEENEEFNLQNAVYQAVLMKEGIETVGSIGHQIFNDLPKIPKLNKDGTMSKAACKTDWETYKKSLLECSLDPLDYLEMKSKLDEVSFFNFLLAYRGKDELNNIWEEIVLPTIDEIAHGTDFTRSLSVWNCQSCQFKDLCLEQLRGQDTSYLLEHNFVTNTYMDQYNEPSSSIL